MAVDEDGIAAVTARLAGATVEDVALAHVDYDWGSPATAGLWRVEVTTSGGRSRSFVKLLRHPRLWPRLEVVPEGPARDFFLTAFPWRFELDMALSGIADVLPTGMRVPELLHHEHFDDDHIGVWSELVEERSGPWSTDELARAAYLLGRLAARRREGAEVNERLPEICRQLPRGAALRYLVEGRVLVGTRAELADDSLWAHPAMMEAVATTGDVDLRGDLGRHLDLALPVLAELDALPQTFAHGDASVQNILVCHGEDDLVVIDWGFGSLLAVGFDLGQLLVGPMHASLAPATEIAAIDSAIFPAYLAGLADEGFAVDADDVRFGYLGSLFARSVFSALPSDELRTAPPDDPMVAALALERVTLTRAMLDLTAPVVAARLGDGTPCGLSPAR
ncbi:phosphotransferase family enzyme [Humibacillus xanthopallidus]|uniref:Phosphotransferase family enzyme n=1 Tax=Humibacillus xanthopallidus TaxID=412689 RepID=A0A543PXS2_9MICO|nr:phosphotransferase [Humibacillus xanthopallidus]TQN48850.1 phosphotransferase family enzyme [Humibacillus xanthopallidus]